MCILKELLAIPKEGVIAFISDSTKEVYLCQGSNLRMLISRVLNDICNGVHNYIEDPSTFSMVVLSSMSSRVDRLIETNYWEKEYRNKGYTILNPRKYIHLTPRLRLHHTGKLIMVELLNRRYDSFVVGVFDKKDLAEQFILDMYGESNPNKFLVYANTKHTKEYIETVTRENSGKIRW